MYGVATSTERVGGSIRTWSGNRIYPLDPRPDEIDIYDIAQALSNLCRFGGHVDSFYSVAEHSVRVSRFLEEYLRGQGWRAEEEIRGCSLTGLLHDSTEAYLVDVPRPLKHSEGFGEAYREAEARLYEVIREKFGLMQIDSVIKYADNKLLLTEARDLLYHGETPDWGDGVIPLEDRIIAWSPAQARTQFLSRYNQLIRSEK